MIFCDSQFTKHEELISHISFMINSIVAIPGLVHGYSLVLTRSWMGAVRNHMPGQIQLYTC